MHAPGTKIFSTICPHVIYRVETVTDTHISVTVIETGGDHFVTLGDVQTCTIAEYEQYATDWKAL